MQPLRAGQVHSRYRVDAYLGGGGMADVYLVTHVELGVQRALKVLKQTGSEVTPRLVREGQLQAKLLHPNIVPVLELIRVEGHPALVMDYVDGPSLDEFLASGKPTLEQIDVIARGLLDGMVAAHRRGLIHRDLKPANVMLDIRDDPPLARITDFGLAKAIVGEAGGVGATATGMMMGTPRYMAPEQFRDAKSVDERADVWSMGAMLFELLTGAFAFPGDSLIDVLRHIDVCDLPPVQTLRPDAPARMMVAIEEALVKDPEERCPSMRELRALWVGSAALAPDTTWDLEPMRREPTPLPAEPVAVASTGPHPSAAAAEARPIPDPGRTDPAPAASDPAPAEPATPTITEPSPPERSSPAASRRRGGCVPVALAVAVVLMGVVGLVGLVTITALGAGGLFEQPDGASATAGLLEQPDGALPAEEPSEGEDVPMGPPDGAVTEPEPRTAAVAEPPAAPPPPPAAPTDPEPVDEALIEELAAEVVEEPSAASGADAPTEDVGWGEWKAHPEVWEELAIQAVAEDGTEYLAGYVPAGTYRMEVYWSDETRWVPVGWMTMETDRKVEITCDTEARSCVIP